MDQKLTADCVQNAVEDLIPAEQLIERVTKALVEDPVTLGEAFIKSMYAGGGTRCPGTIPEGA